MTKSYLIAGVEVVGTYVGAVVGMEEGATLGVAVGVGTVTLRTRLLERSAM